MGDGRGCGPGHFDVWGECYSSLEEDIMYSAEDAEYASCAACSAEVSIFDRVYSFEKDRVLCFGCASERRGVYLDLLDRWTVAPHLDGLSERSPVMDGRR